MKTGKYAEVVLVGLTMIVASTGSTSGQSVKAKPKPAVRDEAAADAIVLRDGKTLLGQILTPSPPGSMLLIVRRAWAEANLPEWYVRWEPADRATTSKATRQNRDRLATWRRERMSMPGSNDRITTWLDRELAKPAGQVEPSVLMVVKLSRPDVKSIKRRSQSSMRALPLGWTLGFADVETMPLDDLKQAIAGRGLSVAGDAPIALDDLLPPRLQTDEQWLLRRAATEVLNDDGVRFVRYGSTVIAESSPGQPADPSTAAALVGDAVKELLGEAPVDPLPAKLRAVGARGKVGALVTRLDIAGDLESVRVESALYVRDPNGRWTQAATRSGIVRTGDVPQAEAKAVGDDPQVQSAFGLIDMLGLGGATADMKQKSLAVGATTKRALGLARVALYRDLSNLAVPLAESGKR